MSDGKKHFETVKANIPSEYSKSVENVGYRRNGRVYEAMLEKILKDALPASKIVKPSPLIPVKREVRMGGYLQPDLHFKDKNMYIEVTTWGDSNMIFSKIMQGFLLKKMLPKARYYVVIADLHLDENWTYDDITKWNEWGEIENIKAVDGWFGFKNIGDLVEEIKGY